MAVNIPAADNLFNLDPDSSIPNSNTRQLIGTVSGTKNTKVNGNLPIDGSPASAWQNGTGNTGGFLFEAQTGNLDVSSDTKILVWSCQYNAPNRIQQNTVANGGLSVRIATGSGTTNYRDFHISGSDTFGGSSQLGPLPFVVDLNSSGHDASNGTFDNTDVDAYGLINNVASQAGTNGTWCFVQRAHIFDTAKNAANIIKFTGVSDFDDLVTAVLGATFATKIGAWVTRLSTSYFVPVAFQIGDTSTATNFDCAGKTIVSPANNEAADPRFRLTTQACRVYIVLRNNAADDADLQNSTWVWGTEAPFDLDVNNLSDIFIDGATFTGMGDFTVGSSVVGAATFTLGGANTVIISGADLDGSTINGNVGIAGSSVTTFTGLTITGALDFDVAGTYNLINCTISEVTNSSGGVITLNLSDGTIVTTNTGPNITLSSITTLELTGLIAGSEVRLYQAGTTTEVDGIENSSTTFSATIAIPSVDLVIFNTQYKPVRTMGIDTTVNVNLPIQQIFDRNYTNP